jgi:LytS/YehU family sensor histidine kinase
MFYWAIYGNNLLMITAYLFSYILNTNIKSRVAEIENIKLKEENIAAELASLKEQISPHFFFNTLSSLSTVIRLQTKEDSLEFVENLSNVYRYILESSEQNLVKLEDEINFIEDYFYLLKNRFGDKIELEKDISSDYNNTFIPPMALQLLVENAIQHNVISNESHLIISLQIDKKYIVVSNNFQKKPSSENFGVGLANLVKRYKLITNKDIIIEQQEKSFTVKLPVI